MTNLIVMPPEQHVQINLLHGLYSQRQHIGMLALKAFLLLLRAIFVFTAPS